MRKLMALILAATMALSLCACGGSDTSTTPKTEAQEESEPVVEAKSIGDTISTDAVEVSLLDVSYEAVYLGGEIIPKEGHSFVVVEFSLKNVGKVELGMFPSVKGGTSSTPRDIVCVDYDDGYTFTVDDVEGNNGENYVKDFFVEPSNVYLSALKPLEDAKTFKVAICVPNEVVENTDAPLLVKFNLLNAEETLETAIFSAR